MTDIHDRLLGRLKGIPDGQVSETARRAGIPERHLRRLREGKSPDVRLSTLEKLALGFGQSLPAFVAALCDPAPADLATPGPADGLLDARHVAKLRRQLDQIQKAVALAQGAASGSKR